jgi:hypothetical protein
MSVDPTHQESFEDTYEEEPEGLVTDGYETPVDDAAEQHTDLLRQRDEPITGRASIELGETDPADLAEQSRIVEENEDEYR